MTNGDLPTNVFSLRQSEFRAIPGNPWVYWALSVVLNRFISLEQMETFVQPKQGLATTENVRFLRFWWELDKAVRNQKTKWFPYMKGGGLLRWFGNQLFFVNWAANGREIKENILLRYPYLNGKWEWVAKNIEFYLREGITWSLVSTTRFGVRYLPPGFIFDVGGSCGFPDKELLFSVMAVGNSPWMNYALRLLNPTINFQIGDIARVPFQVPDATSRSSFDQLVPQCIHLQQAESMHSETTFDFIAPFSWQYGSDLCRISSQRLAELEEKINNFVYELYKISSEDRQTIERELVGMQNISEEEEIGKVEERGDLPGEEDNGNRTMDWLSYAIGIVLGRFQPGTPGALGSAVYRRSDFAIGSLPEPTEEEFNELVGDPSQFAYIDEQGGRHVFSREVEQALQKLAVPDGIAVFDPNHPRDLPTLVSKALELMLGQAQAQEVIQQAAGGDLRKYLEKDFFTQHHIKQYRKRPVYWPIQSSKRSYGFVLFHEKIDRNTFYALQQEPYLPTKRRAVQLRLEELGKKVLTAQGAARKPIEKEMDELRQLAEELAQFAKDLDAITRGGYEPEPDWIDDGVILRMAPLWSVIPLWKSEPKKYWEELAAGKYDWSHIAMKYWPERVKQACKKNKSYAIAHGHEEWYQGG